MSANREAKRRERNLQPNRFSHTIPLLGNGYTIHRRKQLSDGEYYYYYYYYVGQSCNRFLLVPIIYCTVLLPINCIPHIN
jgi:hypothetical protein